MATLTELNEAIIAYDNLWPLLEGDERDVILEKRNELNDQASELATKILRDGVPELNEVIDKLNLATQAAKEAKDSIDNKVNQCNRKDCESNRYGISDY